MKPLRSVSVTTEILRSKWMIAACYFAIAPCAAPALGGTLSASAVMPGVDLAALRQTDSRYTRDLNRLAGGSGKQSPATGDTYGIAVTAFDANGTNGFFISEAGGEVKVFGGNGLASITPSFFGNEGDQMFIIEEVTQLTRDSYEVLIEVVATDVEFNLTNWFADGSESAPGIPFEFATVDIGDFNAPADKLNLIPSTAVTGEYEIESSGFYLLGTEGGFFGPGGDPFNWFDTSTVDGLSGSAAVNFGSDIATTTFGGQEFAGYSISFIVSRATVPEPASFLVAAPALAMAFLRRRLV